MSSRIPVISRDIPNISHLNTVFEAVTGARRFSALPVIEAVSFG
jgi:hypothetical protein